MYIMPQIVLSFIHCNDSLFFKKQNKYNDSLN